MGEWNFQWDSAADNVLHLLVAYLLAAPIGLNREVTTNTAGLRTFPLVAVGACAFVLIGVGTFDTDEAQVPIIYGIVVGIGFIGGGAILKHAGDVSGTATAASIWNTGAIGIAVGWGQIDIAVVLTVVNVFTLYAGRAIKKSLGVEKDSDGNVD
jgi:putative Mg2+ transporter-C (MgtC) family protein